MWRTYYDTSFYPDRLLIIIGNTITNNKGVDNMISDENKAKITSYIVAIVLPILAFLGVSETTSSTIVGVVSAVIGLIIVYYNEKYPSEYISG